MKIFISYGHDDHAKVVKKIYQDLKSEGFDVWIDETKIVGASKFDESIEAGIKESKWVVFFMSPHSLRRPGGVCLDELALAKMTNKELLPVMIQPVEPPLFLTRVQYINIANYFNEDGSLNLELYNCKLQQIIKVLRGEEKLLMEGELNQLMKALSPLDNDGYVYNYNKYFYGREWVKSIYQDWLKSDEKIMFLTGNAGSGKTSIVAELCHKNEEVKAIHFCKYNESDRANPKSVIKSLAYHLATQNEDYRNALLQLNDLYNLDEKNIRRLFSYLIVEPLNSLPKPKESIVLIVDALDEAEFGLKNELADILANEFEKTPEWLKLFVTSRPELEIIRRFKTKRCIVLEDYKEENKKDVIGFIKQDLAVELNEVIDKEQTVNEIYNHSEGSFLYVAQFVKSVKRGHFSILDQDAFPQGLTNIYTSYFSRLFEDEHNPQDYIKDYLPLFQLIIGAYEPLSLEELNDILDLDERDFMNRVEYIAAMFPVFENTIVPIHKSIIDWLNDRSSSGIYSVFQMSSHKLLARYYTEKYDKKRLNDYGVNYLTKHLLNSKQTDLALKILTDETVIAKRIKLNGLDTFARDYVGELEMLFKLDKDDCHDVLIAPTFMKLVLTNRKYFYNSGLYFRLGKLGLIEAFNEVANNYGQQGSLILGNVLYITEKFNEAVAVLEPLLANKDTLTLAEIAEIYSILAMSHRKLVNFDKSNHYTELALTLGGEEDALYEKSLANLMKGKIAFQRLDWESAYIEIENSIKMLQKAIPLLVKDDDKINHEMFIAEYARVFADAAIWHKDYEIAQTYLAKASEIYTRLKVKDRYYVRYIYTTIFLEIGLKEYEKALTSIQKIMPLIESHYDSYQIYLYEAFVHIALKQKNEAMRAINKGLEHASIIEAEIEIASLFAIKDLLEETKEVRLFKNEDTKLWFDYVQRFTKEFI